MRGSPSKSRLRELLQRLLSETHETVPSGVSMEAWSLLADLSSEGQELVSDQTLRPAWEKLIRSGLMAGDVDLYRLADRWAILRKMARRVLGLMPLEDVEVAARAVTERDLEATALGREVLRRFHALEGE